MADSYSWKLVPSKFPNIKVEEPGWLSRFLTSSLIAPSLLICANPYEAGAQSSVRISNEVIAQTVSDDISKRQALITADFSPSIYDNNCKFQDEIDTYQYDQYVKGTKALFNAAKSHVDLVGPVVATDDKVEFKFKETLVFNIPFNPTVDISGHVELRRGEAGGLITYSREFWDQPVSEVLTHVRFQ